MALRAESHSMSVSDLEEQHTEELGEYRLLRQVGQGSFSQVYLDTHTAYPSPLAIKLLHPDVPEEDAENFLIQAAILASLEHPHIIHVYDFGTVDGTPYVAMSYAPGGTLRGRYPRGAKLAISQVVQYARQIAEALQYVHDHGLIHRDVKPHNMLLAEDGTAVLSDFGAAIVAESVESGRDFEGTIIYAAPEQIKGKPQFGSDQYALGVVVYEWLCGEWPFTGTYFEVSHHHLFTPAPSLREKGADVSMTIEDVVLRALAKDPERRFARVVDFATALEEAAVVDEALKRQKTQPTRSPTRRQFRLPGQFER